MEWERTYTAAKRFVPCLRTEDGHGTVSRTPYSRPIVVEILTLTGMQLPDAVIKRYQSPSVDVAYRLTFFHKATRRFFGATYRGAGLGIPLSRGTGTRTLDYNEDIYFHSTLQGGNVLLCIEFVMQCTYRVFMMWGQHDVSNACEKSWGRGLLYVPLRGLVSLLVFFVPSSSSSSFLVLPILI